MTDLTLINEVTAYEDGGIIVFDSLDDLRQVAGGEIDVFASIEKGTSDANIKSISADMTFKWMVFSEFVGDLKENPELNEHHKRYFIAKIFYRMKIAASRSEAMISILRGNVATISRWIDFIMTEDEITRIRSSFDSAIMACGSIASDYRLRLLANDDFSGKIDYIQKSVDELAQRTGTISEKAKEAGEQLTNIKVQNIPFINKSIEQAMEMVSKIHTESHEQIEIASQEFRSRWMEFQALVNGGIARESLKAPSKLWSEDGLQHESNAQTALGVAFTIGVMSILMLPEVARKSIVAANELLGGPQLALARLAFSGATILVFLTFALWATRIAVRYYMTEQHLRNDCRNRAAVTEAFISLQKHMDSKFDATALIATLMRPAQDGIVQDDGLPAASPAAIISQILEKKTGS